jgi:DNA-directed RNA polymerase specialized sigma24 family protein
MSTASVRSDTGPDDDTIAMLVDRIRRLEAQLAEHDELGHDPDGDHVAADDAAAPAHRKPKGGPIDDDTRRDLVHKRERLELARLAEQAAWEDVKAAVKHAAAEGASYREIAEVIGVTRARVYQLVSGKR